MSPGQGRYIVDVVYLLLGAALDRQRYLWMVKLRCHEVLPTNTGLRHR